MNVRRFIEKVDKKKREILKQSKLSNAELHMFMAGMNSAMSAIEEGGGDCCGWIPVEERLPGTERVLITNGEFVKEGYRRPDGVWKYGRRDDELFSSLSNKPVIAWMPLPEPYNSQKEGDSVNNYAAIGYALLAADEMEMTVEQKERLWQLMYSIMDEVGESKAEKRFKGAVEG